MTAEDEPGVGPRRNRLWLWVVLALVATGVVAGLVLAVSWYQRKSSRELPEGRIVRSAPAPCGHLASPSLTSPSATPTADGRPWVGPPRAGRCAPGRAPAP